MTKDDILNMPAGREMDALIAVNIMGWARDGGLVVPPKSHEASINNWCAEWDRNGCPDWMPHYSTDISAAWEVVEKVINYNYLTLESLDSKNYAASFDSIIDDPEWYEDVTNYRYAARAKTASLAICRAALLAVMDNKDV